MTVGWQRIRLPLMERLALADLAERRQEPEEAVLAEIVRDAVKRELAAERSTPLKQRVTELAAERNALLTERDALLTERNALRDELAAANMRELPY